MCKYEHLVSDYDFKKAFQREITQNGLEWVCIFTPFFPPQKCFYFGDRKCVFRYDGLSDSENPNTHPASSGQCLQSRVD